MREASFAKTGRSGGEYNNNSQHEYIHLTENQRPNFCLPASILPAGHIRGFRWHPGSTQEENIKSWSPNIQIPKVLAR